MPTPPDQKLNRTLIFYSLTVISVSVGLSASALPAVAEDPAIEPAVSTENLPPGLLLLIKLLLIQHLGTPLLAQFFLLETQHLGLSLPMLLIKLLLIQRLGTSLLAQFFLIETQHLGLSLPIAAR